MNQHLHRFAHIALVLVVLTSLFVPTLQVQADPGLTPPEPGGTVPSSEEVQPSGSAFSAGDPQPAGPEVEVIDGWSRMDGSVDSGPAPAEPLSGDRQTVEAASIFDHNLIVNGNAEAGTTGAGAPNWTPFSTRFPLTVMYSYEANPDVPTPLLNDPGPMDRGTKLFISSSAASSCTAITTAYQDIDLSSVASTIASGQVTFTASGYFGGSGNTSGTGWLTVDFIDASNNMTPSPVAQVGGITAAQRLNQTGLVYASATGKVPPTARKARLHLKFLDAGAVGCPSQAYADNLSFVVEKPQMFIPVVQNGAMVAPNRSAPAAPTGLAASINQNSGVDVTWTDNANNETGYRIERKVAGVDTDFKVLDTVGANISAYFDNSYPIYYQQLYTYRITSFNNVNAAPGVTVTFTPPAAPVAAPNKPAACWVNNLTSTSTIFGWTDSSDNEEYFSLWIAQQGVNNGEYRLLAYIEPNATYVTIIDLAPGVLTALAVQAENKQGAQYSNICYVTFTPPALTSTTKYFRLNNKASYPINSLIIDGVEQLPVYPMSVPVNAYYEIPLQTGQHTIQYTIGWWQDKTSRFNMYTFWRLIDVTDPAGSYTMVDPAITDLMTQFSSSGYWEGYYYDSNIICHTMAFRFYSNGSYENYASNRKIGSGTYSYVARNTSQFAVKFNVTDPTESTPMPGLLNEIYGYYYMNNGPASWNQIEYTYKPQGYVYNPFCP